MVVILADFNEITSDVHQKVDFQFEL